MPLTRRGQRSYQKILDAAWPLFYERGVNATSVDDILAAADMGKSQFYHYFPTKEALVCAVVDFHIGRILEYLEPHSAKVEKVEDLETWFDAYVELAQFQDCLGCPVGVIAAETAVTSESVQERVRAAFYRWVEILAKALERLKARGEFKSDFQAQEAAEFVGSCVQGSLLLTRAFRDAGYLKRTWQHVYRYLASWTA